MSCPSTGTHGTVYAYKRHGCRCPETIERVKVKRHQHCLSRWARSNRGTGRSQPRHRDVDPFVLAIIAERPAPLGIEERWLVIDEYTDAGKSAEEIARMLDISARTVVRRRSQRRNRAKSV